MNPGGLTAVTPEQNILVSPGTYPATLATAPGISYTMYIVSERSGDATAGTTPITPCRRFAFERHH